MKSRYALFSLLLFTALLLFTPSLAEGQSVSQDLSALEAAPGINVQAQPSTNMPAEQGQIFIGVGAAYNSHVEDPGVGAGIWYQITPMISAGAQFTYFLLEDIEGISESIFTVDIMGAYPLMEAESGLVLSALAGLNYLKWSYEVDDCGGFGGFGVECDLSGSDVGLNAGGMAVYPLGNLNVFVQVFVVGLGDDSSGIQLNGGVSFGL